MTPKPVIAIFDIGKTNKKLFLFDQDYKIVLEDSKPFEESVDEDGFPCEDIVALTDWVKQSLVDITSRREFKVEAINFSTYGASFVHTDSEGRPVTALYNYLKPFPEKLVEQFYPKYGGELFFSMQTASPVLGNLNSGMQLYLMKEEKPAIFEKVRYSLHLPQFMSFLVTGRAYSDITSIGCHTALWNFSTNYYHEWLFLEGIAKKMAPVFPSDQAMPCTVNGQAMLCGVGLHDSSAALIPYLSSFEEPFLLISTGTWCISLNPFNQTSLRADELQQDCLCYMEYRGKPIKASRFFAGYEHEKQLALMAEHFHVEEGYYKSVKADPALILTLQANTDQSAIMQFSGETIAGRRDLSLFASYEEAYHQFMMDLVAQQVVSTNLVLKNSPVKRIYVDGGFGKNNLYMHLLARAYPDMEIYAASIAQASAIGAALAIHSAWNKSTAPTTWIELQSYHQAAAKQAM